MSNHWRTSPTLAAAALIGLSILAVAAVAQEGGPGIRITPAPRPPTLLVSASPGTSTTGTAEEVLYTYPLAANKLIADTTRFRLRWVFSTAANTNLKVARLRIGSLAGTEVCSMQVDTPGILGPLLIECIRSSMSTLDCWCFGQVSAESIGIVGNKVEGLDFTAELPLVVTGHTASAAGEMTLSTVRVDGP